MIVVPARTTPPQTTAARADQVEILVIDRQPLFLAALQSLLERPAVAAHVTTSQSSERGIELAKTEDVDLVCCELRAEPVSGLDLAAELARERPGLPVILLGELSDESQLAEAVAANVAGVFTKSSDPDEFLAGVNAVMSGHRAIGSGVIAHLFSRSTSNHRPDHHPAHRLSSTELEILAMIGQARSIPAIAASRGISNKTVRNHLAKIYRKLELHGRTEAVLWAARMGITGG